MKKRMRVSRRKSKKMYGKSAARTHKKNTQRRVMRGGIRL